jgi:hypothetical protein
MTAALKTRSTLCPKLLFAPAIKECHCAGYIKHEPPSFESEK